MGDFLPVKAYETVSVYRSGAAVKLELNRPDRMNALNRQLRVDLLEAVQDIALDEGARAVLLTGAGRAFSSGADLREGRERTPDGHPDVYSVLTSHYHPIIRCLREMPKPVVAAVNGAAAGSGSRWRSRATWCWPPSPRTSCSRSSNIGLVPDGGSSLLVPSRIGFARAAELAMLGERLGAAKALDWGLINQVWPDDELAERAEALCTKLAAGPTGSYAGTKRQLNRWLYQNMAEQLEFEAVIQQERAGSADFAEGVAAFAEKRAPEFHRLMNADRPGQDWRVQHPAADAADVGGSGGAVRAARRIDRAWLLVHVLPPVGQAASGWRAARLGQGGEQAGDVRPRRVGDRAGLVGYTMITRPAGSASGRARSSRSCGVPRS